MIAETPAPRPPARELAPKSKAPNPMNLQDPVHVLCTLLGITPTELSIPCRILRIDPNERNTARIEEASRACFARVQSVQHHVPAECGQWMMEVITHARSEMLRAAHRPSVPPPQVATTSHAAVANHEPPVAIRPRMPRHARRFTLDNVANAIGAVVTCGLLIGAVGWFVNQSWEDMNDRTRRKANGPGLGLVEADPAVKAVANGGGRSDRPRQKLQPAPTPKPTETPNVAKAKETLQQSLKLARQGSFKEAQRVAARARSQLPDESDGLSYLISYAEQYPTLADEARGALNGSSEVDLGMPYGKAQFVEQNADEITFFAKGRHKSFSVKEFNSRKGVRFRVFRNYLDNAGLPANHLIIGAYQFLLRVNEQGEQDAAGGLPEAKSRIRKAITGGDADTVEQGTLMMKAIDFLANEK